MSISPTFYEQLFFVKKVFCTISPVKVWLRNFFWKNIGAKAARTMLVKLIAGLNFINVLRTAFVLLRTAFVLVDPKSVKRY